MIAVLAKLVDLNDDGAISSDELKTRTTATGALAFACFVAMTATAVSRSSGRRALWGPCRLRLRPTRRSVFSRLLFESQ